MELLEPEVSARLSESDSEYRKLVDEHRHHEQELASVSARRPFTPEDWFERSELKKRKLRLKDRMAEIARDLLPPAAAGTRSS